MSEDLVGEPSFRHRILPFYRIKHKVLATGVMLVYLPFFSFLLPS
jgi:hypothetical protein